MWIDIRIVRSLFIDDNPTMNWLKSISKMPNMVLPYMVMGVHGLES